MLLGLATLSGGDDICHRILPPDLASLLPLAVAYLLFLFDLYYYYVSSFLVRLDDGFSLGPISL